jgi:DNA replication protein DnaC
MQNLIDNCREFKLLGMAQALERQLGKPQIDDLSFPERLMLLLDHERTHRSDRRFSSRLKLARLKDSHAAIEDIDFKTHRGLDKSQILALSSCEWISNKINIMISGPTGTGKTFIACALAQRACREGYSCRYFRMPRLLQDLAVSRADGSYGKLMNTLSKTDLIILDDWGIQPLSDEGKRDFLEVIDDRYKTRSMIITSQLPIENWFEQIGDPTIADAIMDRIINSSYKFQLKGKSMRSEDPSLTNQISVSKKH